MDRPFLNQLNAERVIDPEKALRKLRVVQLLLAASGIEQKVKDLRTNGLKSDREIKDACLFCHGMSQRQGQKIWLIPGEQSDYDFVAMWQVGDYKHLAPTQLKEVVSHERNPRASIQSVINGLKKYRASDELTVAIYFDRAERFEPATIMVPPLRLASLWVFGCLTADQSQWFLYGNMLEEAPTYSTFFYPEPTGEEFWR